MPNGLKIISGPHHGRFFLLTTGTQTLGRDPHNPIQLESTLVSREHARLTILPDQITLEDLNSANGTLVNQQTVTRAILKAGDQINIGDFVLELVLDDVPRMPLRQQETFMGKLSATLQQHQLTQRWLKKLTWRGQLLLIISLALGLDHLIVANLFQDYSKRHLLHLALQRGHDLTRFLAEKNKEDLAQARENLLDITSATQQSGVVAAYITNIQGHIVAPASQLNQAANDDTTRKALLSNLPQVEQSPRLAGGLYRLSTPIRIYRDALAGYETIGAATIHYLPSLVYQSSQSSQQIWLVTLLLAPFFSFALFFIVQAITLPPIKELVENIDVLIKGGCEKIDRQHPIGPLMPLIDSLNALAVRLANTTPTDGQLTDNKTINELPGVFKWLLTALSEALVIMDKNGTVLALNQRAKQHLGLEITQPQRQTRLDALTQEPYRGCIKTCIERLQQSQTAHLTEVIDVAAATYQLHLHAFRQQQQLHYLLLVISKI